MSDVQIAVSAVPDNQVIALGEDVSIITPPPESVGVIAATAVSMSDTSSINTFDDVDTSTVTPTNGQALVWDQATGKWMPRTSVLSTVTGITGATAITNCVAISQANYDAIATPDPNTLYVIV